MTTTSAQLTSEQFIRLIDLISTPILRVKELGSQKVKTIAEREQKGMVFVGDVDLGSEGNESGPSVSFVLQQETDREVLCR